MSPLTPNFASKSQVFRTHATGGGGGASPTGAGNPTFAGRSNIFTVPKGGGGALFAHGCVQGPDYKTLWDTDGYTDDPDWSGNIRVPVGLGGIYLLLASCSYSGISGSSGWWGTYWNVANPEGSPNNSGPVGQWQQGYRALQALSSDGGVQMAWVGEVVEGAVLSVRTFTGGCGPTDFHLQSLSAFRLGAVGEEGFHGALMYRTDTSYLGNDNPGMCGATLFDTDDYVGTGDVGDIDSNGFGIPSGLGGVYFYCTTYTFQVKNMAPFAPNPPYWPYGYDFALIPVLTDLVSGSYTNPPYGSLPDNSYNRWPSQSELGGADINDIGINNTMAITSFWIGRIEDGGFASVIPIPDFSSAWDDEQVWLHDTDPALSYQALIRIAE